MGAVPVVEGVRHELVKQPVLRRNAHDNAADDRQHGQNPQRLQHRRRRFVRVHLRGVEALLAPEGHEKQPEHVERRHEGGTQAQHPPQDVTALDRRGQDFVLAPESREGRNAGNRNGRQQHRAVGVRDVALQPAHAAHVLLLVHGVDDAAGAEKEQALEEGVRHDVEQAGGERAHPAAEEHVAQLADRGIGQHPLDVGLHQGDAGSEQRRDRPDARHHVHRDRRQQVQRLAAHHHVDARRDHGGSVNQGTNRRWPFHGVGQPHVQRNLRRFTHGADEEQQGNGGGDAGGDLVVGSGGEHVVVRQRAGGPENQRHRQDEAGVADAVDDEGFLAGVGGRAALVPEADQQVGAQPHPLPADEHQQVVVGQHQHQHGGHEQVEVGEEARVAGVAVHVADGIHVHQEADAAHHEQHDGAQRVDHQPHVHREGAGENPGIQLGLDRVLRVGDDAQDDDQGEQQGQPDRADAEVMGLVTQDAPPQQAVEQHGHGGQNRDQPHENFHRTDNSFVIKGWAGAGAPRRGAGGLP